MTGEGPKVQPFIGLDSRLRGNDGRGVEGASRSLDWIPACAGMTGEGPKVQPFIGLDSRLRGNDESVHQTY
jgi:hypothetical protein